MRISSAGNVGIGTASPGSIGSNVTTLEIRGKNNNYTGGVRLTSLDGSTLNYSLYGVSNGFYIENDTTNPTLFFNDGAETARITSTGNVGIGDDGTWGET